MNRVHSVYTNSPAESDLERVDRTHSPATLATEQPKAALMTALAVLFNEARPELPGSHGTNQQPFPGAIDDEVPATHLLGRSKS